jgi:hypothetical protein
MVGFIVLILMIVAIVGSVLYARRFKGEAADEDINR